MEKILLGRFIRIEGVIADLRAVRRESTYVALIDGHELTLVLDAGTLYCLIENGKGVKLTLWAQAQGRGRRARLLILRVETPSGGMHSRLNSLRDLLTLTVFVPLAIGFVSWLASWPFLVIPIMLATEGKMLDGLSAEAFTGYVAVAIAAVFSVRGSAQFIRRGNLGAYSLADPSAYSRPA